MRNKARRVILLVAASLFIAAAVCAVSARLLYPYKYGAEIGAAARRYGLSPALVCGVIRVESRFDPESVSAAGAVGLMQLLPSTALYIAEREDIEGFNFALLYEPETNIRLGCAYLKYLTDKFGGDRDLALAAYNAGEGAVRGWLNNKSYSPDGKILTAIPYKETREYAGKVRKAERFYSKIYGVK